MPKRRHRGDGSIETLPSGKFRAIMSLGVVGGKRTKVRFTHRDRAKAMAWLRSKQAERDRGGIVDDGGLTVGAWLLQWLDAHKSRVEHNTYRPYRSHVHEHILKHAVSKVRLVMLRPAAVEQLYADLAAGGVSAAMQRAIGVTLGTALQAAVRLNYIAGNPARAAQKPKHSPPEMQTWTAAEVVRFLDAIRDDRLEAMFVLALDTGMRQGELLALEWESVDLDAGRVRVVHSLEEPSGLPPRIKAVKTKAGRRLLALSPAAVASLRLHRRLMLAEGRDVDAGKVFPSLNGKWLWKSALRNHKFDPAVKRAGVRWIRFHDLRHTHATLSLAAGANLRAVSARLGHTNPAFTLKTYAHVMPECDERIAQIWDGLLSPLAREE